MLEIQRFVTEVLESVGAIVEPVEYGLSEVIIPDQYKNMFQNRTELKLAFDFEVAQENEESEFVTFGSNVFNSILDIANTSAITTVRYAIVDNLRCFNAEAKILNSLHSELPPNTRVNILEQRPIMVPIILFNFKATYSSDIQVLEDIEIWINLYNNNLLYTSENEKETIFFEKTPIYSYPLGKKHSLIEAFAVSIKAAENVSKSAAHNYNRGDELQSELVRIKSYYTELELENAKRLSRKGLTDEKAAEIRSKDESLKLECIKQEAEIKNKYNVKTSINLMNAIIYYIPYLEFKYEVYNRNDAKQIFAIYNPIKKSFEEAFS